MWCRSRFKAVGELDDVHRAQAINYTEAFNLEIGLLINFGAKRLAVPPPDSTTATTPTVALEPGVFEL